MTCLRRLFVGGLYMMGAVAVGAAVSSSVAAAAAAAFTVVATAAVAATAVVAGLWLCRELAWRRELRTVIARSRPQDTPVPVAPLALSQLRRPA